MKNILYVFALISYLFSPMGLYANPNLSKFDLTIIGRAIWRDSLCRLPILLTELFQEELAINFISTLKSDYTEVTPQVKTILMNPNKTAGNVALMFDILWDKVRTPSDFVPKESLIKIAYSMLESSAIPPQWVTILNQKFDAVAVPDAYYQSVYKNCGVKIPVFVLPHGLALAHFLQEKPNLKPKRPFIFGCSAAFIKRKNHELLIEAFHKEFGNNPAVQLKIHGRNALPEFNYKAIAQKVNSPWQKKTKRLAKGTNRLTPNIELILAPLPETEYKKFLMSLDCYVLLSKGEGFSMTPREALALGKPCIISNNTAHATIASTGYVYAVPSTIAEPAYYAYWGISGYNYGCTMADARRALREVYTNYQLYLEKALDGRIWVEHYLWKNVKAKFRNLIKPMDVRFGDENIITDEYIMTNDASLYAKYSLLRQAKK